MPPPKILPSTLHFVNALMPSKKGRNEIVQSIMRQFPMCSVGLYTCELQIILYFIFFPYPQIISQNYLPAAKKHTHPQY